MMSSAGSMPIRGGDRFLPNRSPGGIDNASSCMLGSLRQDSHVGTDFAAESAKHEYQATLRSCLGVHSSRILSFHQGAPPCPVDTEQKIMGLSLFSRLSRLSPSQRRPDISRKGRRIVDLKQKLPVDLARNLVCWIKDDVLAAERESEVLVIDVSSATQQVPGTILSMKVGLPVSSLSCMQERGGKILAIGLCDGGTVLFDIIKNKEVRTLSRIHRGRVGSLSWNGNILSTGGKDGNVFNHDIRIPNDTVSTLSGHTGEVCGLTWSPDGTMLASGGSDKKVLLWSAFASSGTHWYPQHYLTEHKGGVRALAWSPHKDNLLATGGADGDGSIKMWNTQSGALRSSIGTGSAIGGILWNPHKKEFLSSHGSNRNRFRLWKYPNMEETADFNMRSRSLSMVLSPDGFTVGTVSVDGIVRMWDVFASDLKVARKEERRARREGLLSRELTRVGSSMLIR